MPEMPDLWQKCQRCSVERLLRVCGGGASGAGFRATGSTSRCGRSRRGQPLLLAHGRTGSLLQDRPDRPVQKIGIGRGTGADEDGMRRQPKMTISPLSQSFRLDVSWAVSKGRTYKSMRN